MVASVKETYRDMLTRYPSIFPTPLDVSCHLFCGIGIGMEWVDGELVKSMDRDDKSINPPRKPEIREGAGAHLDQLHLSWDLQYQAKMIRYNFVLEHMEEILSCPVDMSLFREDRRHGYYEVNPCVRYAHAFDFPDDIKPDWAEATRTIVDWWIVNLRSVYGVDHDRETERAHWPADINLGYDALLLSRNRIHKIITGEDYEVTSARNMQFVTEYLAERKRKEQDRGEEVETKTDNSVCEVPLAEGCGPDADTERVQQGETLCVEVHDSQTVRLEGRAAD